MALTRALEKENGKEKEKIGRAKERVFH